MCHRPSRLFAAGLLLTLAAGAAAAQGRLAPPDVFPNPHVAGPLTVHYDGTAAEAPALEVFDVLGRRVTPSSALPAGTYLLRLRYADGRVTEAGRLTKLAGDPLEMLLLPETAVPETAAPETAAPAAAASCTGPLWEGLWREPIGSAEINITPEGDAVISGIGASGTDGVRACLGRATGAGVRFAGLDLLRPNLSANWTLRGNGPQGTGPLAVVSFQRSQGLALSVDLTRTGARDVQLEVWDGTDVVHAVTIPAAAFSVEISGVSAGVVLKEAFGGLTLGRPGESAMDLLHVGSLTFENPVTVHLGDHDYAGTRLVFRAPLPAVYTATDDLWRFARTGVLVLEDAAVGAIGLFHSLPDALDPTSLILDAEAPAGPLAVRCPSSGCPSERGVQVRVPPARERLRVDLQPVAVPGGGTSRFRVGLDWTASDGQGAGEPLTLDVRSDITDGIILRMDKEFCDEAPASDECAVRMEYRRNGQVVMVRTFQAGVPLRFPVSLHVRSVEGVVTPVDGSGGRKPITWEVRLGVSIRGGQEELRFSGSGPTPAVLDGLTLLTNQPLRINAAQSCPGWPGCGSAVASPPETASLEGEERQRPAPFE